VATTIPGLPSDYFSDVATGSLPFTRFGPPTPQQLADCAAMYPAVRAAFDQVVAGARLGGGNLGAAIGLSDSQMLAAAQHFPAIVQVLAKAQFQL
jgi:hypothetical protein